MTYKINYQRLALLFAANLIVLPLYFVGFWKAALVFNLVYTLLTAAGFFTGLFMMKYAKKVEEKHFSKEQLKEGEEIKEVDIQHLYNIRHAGGDSIDGKTILKENMSVWQ